MVVRAFLARKDTVTPMIISAITLIVSVSISLLIMGPVVDHGGLSGAIVGAQSLLTSLFPSSSLGHVGIALASAITPTLSFLLLALILTLTNPDTSWRGFLWSTVRAMVSSSVMILVLLYLTPSNQNFSLIQLLIGISIGILSYLAASTILLSVEAQETFDLIRRFTSRGKR
jgi:peptidoglycan biosynthesis protein MviN/MurJ (putative lipid II flippase)